MDLDGNEFDTEMSFGEHCVQASAHITAINQHLNEMETDTVEGHDSIRYLLFLKNLQYFMRTLSHRNDVDFGGSTSRSRPESKSSNYKWDDDKVFD